MKPKNTAYTKANILSAANEKWKQLWYATGETFHGDTKNESTSFDTSCKCDEHLCVHKVVLFLQLLNAYGPYYFDSIRNWDKQKNKLLEAYGYSLDDDLTGKFEFTYKDGKPFLRVLDPSIKRVDPVSAGMSRRQVAVPEKEPVTTEEASPLTGDNGSVNRIGIVFNETGGVFPGFGIDAVSEEKETGRLYRQIETGSHEVYQRRSLSRRR